MGAANARAARSASTSATTRPPTTSSRGAFTVALADAAHVAEADYFGIATGRKVDKAAASGLTFIPSEHVDAPVIEEFPLTMECIVKEV
ncbi:MAG TPA: flavin reductase [Atopobiaceae bacterium]|nr:flavin reductase [Atopobiaceae bacterium]